MILDGQNYFSDIANGDSPVNVADDASLNVIDQQGKNSIFTEGGGANVALWLIVRVQVTATSNGSATVQAVLQDSPDNATWTDRLVGSAIAVASVTAGSDLLNARIPSKLARYLRVIYRVGTAALTAGTFLSFLTLDEDRHDLSQRETGTTVSEPTGALDESAANGVLAG